MLVFDTEHKNNVNPRLPSEKKVNYIQLFFVLIIIVAFLQKATIEYSLESLCVSVRVCVFSCVCVLLHVNSKRINLET